MRTLPTQLFILSALFWLSACRRSVNLNDLTQLVELSKPFAKEEICIIPKGKSSTSGKNYILFIIKKSGYDCSQAIFSLPDQNELAREDSVLILTKRSFLKFETLYYDFDIS